MSELTHFNQAGEAHMVNVGDKNVTQRIAIAEGEISMQAETLQRILQGGHKKGDVLGIARIAGIMAAKKTGELIPLCHPLMLTHVSVEFTPLTENDTLYCQARVETRGQTALTFYFLRWGKPASNRGLPFGFVPFERQNVFAVRRTG